MQFFKNYFLDFWIWWYWFKAKRVLASAWTSLLQTIGYLDLIPMATNLFQPLFQDRTWEGRAVAFPIRFGWVLVGLTIVIIYFVLMVAVLICYFLIPLLPFAVLINSLMHFV